MIVASVNMGTSIFGGFVTFSLIGSIAHETNRQMKDLVESGKLSIYISAIVKVFVLFFLSFLTKSIDLK